MLNLSLVRTFVALVETGSFSEAAQRLGLAQPTVTQHIQKLENNLGVLLIERSHAACTPSAQGHAMLPYARALIATAERFEAAATGDHLRIGTSGNIASYYISAGIKSFTEAYEHAFQWDLHVTTNPEISDLLLKGEIDIAVMEWPDTRASFQISPWRREPLVVIVPPDHLLFGKKTITIKQLLSLELIGGEGGSGTGTLLTEALGKRAQKIKMSYNLHNTEAVKSAVKEGLGCSIVLKKAIESEKELNQLGALTVKGLNLEKTFHIALLKDIPTNTLAAKFAAFLCQKASKRNRTL